jgi:hypothetical protein
MVVRFVRFASCVYSTNTMYVLCVCVCVHVCVCMCVCVCVCGLFVTLCVTCNFDADARVRISKNTLKEPMTMPSLEEHDQWQLELFSLALKD